MPQTVPSTNVMCSYRGDELAERERGQRVAEDRGRRAVALKAAGRDDLLGRALGAHLVGRLAKGERLGLGQEVAQEQLVHVLTAVGRRGWQCWRKR